MMPEAKRVLAALQLCAEGGIAVGPDINIALLQLTTKGSLEAAAALFALEAPTAHLELAVRALITRSPELVLQHVLEAERNARR